MTPWLLEHAQCPFCTGRLAISTALEETGEELRYGVLTCSQCAELFAVVEGIPLLAAQGSRVDVKDETTDRTLLAGTRLADVIARIRAGDAIGAFALLLNPTSLAAPSWTFDPMRVPRRRYVLPQANKSPGSGAGTDSPSRTAAVVQRLKLPYRRARAAWRRSRIPQWRERLARYLRENVQSLSATDLFGLYYGEYSGANSIGDYFLFRFGQPRHLAALSAVSTLRHEDGVVLDLACGAGHLTHYLTYGLPRVRAVGVDREFFRLYVAKVRMAPSADFICMPADLSLPFRSSLFSGVVCSDAFHYFRHKSIAAKEIARVLATDGALILTRVGNSGVEPNEGYELAPSGYRDLFPSLESALRGEEQLMSDYLHRRGPDLSQLGQSEVSGQEKWLTLFASRRRSLFRVHGEFSETPHAVGRLVVNPIFRNRQTRPDGALVLEFAFPSDWYAFEDAAYPQYASGNAVIPAEVVAALRGGNPCVSVREHVERFELIGTPDRFLTDIVSGEA